MVPLGSKSTSEIPPNLYPNLDASNPAQKKIAFFRFVDPFVRLLESGGTASLDAFIFVIDFTLDFAYAIFDVFSRIILPAPFNPEDPLFIEKVKNFEIEAGLLKSKMDDLPRLLENDFHLKETLQMLSDLKSLKKLQNEIEKPLLEVSGYLKVMRKLRKNPLPIVNDLSRLEQSYQELKHDYDQLFKLLVKTIVSKFQETVDHCTNSLVDQFSQGWNKDNSEIQKNLLKTWTALRDAVPSNSSDVELSELTDWINGIEAQINALDEKFSPENCGPLELPFRLRNSGDTSCYMDSILQAYAFIFDEIIRPLPPLPPLNFQDGEDEKVRQGKRVEYHKKRVEYHKRIAVQNVLKEIVHQQSKGKDLSNERLREVIFKSGLHDEFKQPKIKEQLDAASMAEFLTAQFLPHSKYQQREYVSSLTQSPRVRKTGKDRNPPLSVLQISLVTENNPKPLNQLTLDDFIQAYLNEQIVNDTRIFEPKKKRKHTSYASQKKNGIQSVENVENDVLIVNQYKQWYRIEMLPPVLTMQFKRFEAVIKDEGIVLNKVNQTVLLPKDNIVDLSKYYDAPKGESNDARYKIKSIVVHQGPSVHGGHYVTYTEMNGKYFFCNDTLSSYYNEITKEEFLGVTDAYLLVLEKVS